MKERVLLWWIKRCIIFETPVRRYETRSISFKEVGACFFYRKMRSKFTMVAALNDLDFRQAFSPFFFLYVRNVHFIDVFVFDRLIQLYG